MLTFKDLPKARKAEINQVARAISEVFKTNKLDRKDLTANIRRNLLYMFNNELPVTTSIFSGDFKGAWNANSNEIVNDWNSSDAQNPKKITLKNLGVVRNDEEWAFPADQQYIFNAPETVTHVQYATLGLFVRETGIPVIQFSTDNLIYGVADSMPQLIAIDAGNEGTSIQYLFVVVLGLRKIVKEGQPDKYVRDSKSIDGLALIPAMT